jgi:hypothetical protein
LGLLLYFRAKVLLLLLFRWLQDGRHTRPSK